MRHVIVLLHLVAAYSMRAFRRAKRYMSVLRDGLRVERIEGGTSRGGSFPRKSMLMVTWQDGRWVTWWARPGISSRTFGMSYSLLEACIYIFIHARICICVVWLPSVTSQGKTARKALVLRKRWLLAFLASSSLLYLFIAHLFKISFKEQVILQYFVSLNSATLSVDLKKGINV